MSIQDLINILESSSDKDSDVLINNCNVKGKPIDIEFVTVFPSGGIWIEAIIPDITK